MARKKKGKGKGEDSGKGAAGEGEGKAELQGKIEAEAGVGGRDARRNTLPRCPACFAPRVSLDGDQATAKGTYECNGRILFFDDPRIRIAWLVSCPQILDEAQAATRQRTERPPRPIPDGFGFL